MTKNYTLQNKDKSEVLITTDNVVSSQKIKTPDKI